LRDMSALFGKATSWLARNVDIREGTRRLLIVDDDRLVQRVLERTLANSGFSITMASSPTEAIEAIADEAYQVVVSDYRMNGMNGLDLLKEIKLRSPDSVLLLMSGSAYLEEAMDAMNHQWLFQFIVKPWASNELRDIIRRAFEQHDANLQFNRLTREIGNICERGGAAPAAAGIALGRLVNSFFLALVKVSDCRSAEPRSHSRRLALYARRLAVGLDVPEEHRQSIECAALLHDIGNICVPEGILRKGGLLTPAERDLVRQHPECGFSIINDIEILEDASLIVLDHHERWDGNGYPRGLSGEQIHTGARILAVVDAYDAMVNARPYRDAIAPEEANGEIRMGSGSQFEPRVVEAWMGISDEEKEALRKSVSEVPGRIA